MPPEGYFEHAEEALRHANLAISTMSILDHGMWDDAEPLITVLETSLEKARNFKTVIDRVVKERVLVSLLPPIQLMVNLITNEDKLKLFLERSIAAMDAIHGPPQAATKNNICLDGAPAYDPEASLLLKDLLARLRSANKAPEAAP
ncbi:hypothetical protein CFIO01_02244 [Colletotrichum fioriniae PJ7]|uniref:Uncharacterized protein n=1 Tax=Colletotrichum fioriniae PJ7 TaxID=1445577 RepID=A0A010RBZ5_9PEZI|nr:hypothetical protein CFIO01_02244 [Colletotrichum fioriniae PJ7]